MIDQTWTLFLDRDGVINERLPGAYIDRWEDFQFRERVPQSISYFSSIFSKIIVVTNQQGIGKDLMTAYDLTALHHQMMEELSKFGARIDGIYFCPDLKTKIPNCRKPAPNMALAAQRDFPSIDFQKSIMVGDSLSDIQFGNALGMKTILIESKLDELEKINHSEEKIDYRFQHLWQLAEDLEEGL